MASTTVPQRPTKVRKLVGWKEGSNWDMSGGPRKTAHETVATALFTPGGSPLLAASPYHAFAKSPATAAFARPDKWPGPVASSTKARLLWDRNALYVCWELEGDARAPVDASAVESDALTAFLNEKGHQDVRAEQRTILFDERVECFLWQPKEATNGSARPDASYDGETYHCFEINFDGKALAFRPAFGKLSGYDWDSSKAFKVWTQELPVGFGQRASPVPTPDGDCEKLLKRVVIAEIYWAELGIDIGREVRIGLHRAEYPNALSWLPGRKAGRAELDAVEFVWSTFVEPGDDKVSFHRPSLFGKLVLASEESPINCSCVAARWLGQRSLGVVSSPIPSLDDCPPGSLLVQAKYASLCGSDLPYFREKRAASCYWDRDGFCGHEVVGIVIASKSEKFQPGDAVLALPSSYFKAHAGTKQDWYKEEVYGILFDNFPVRGGFSEVYTSHELYSTKMKQCVPEMLAAQGLGTVLKMTRRIGSVQGKTVVVLGQGQNGLLGTRLMAQMCAKDVIAVDPLEYRRKLALKTGATVAVPPEEAQAAVNAASNGRGADVVLEMVGHCQETINDSIRLAACGGIVAAFGVPDDAVYKVEFSLFFRKNIALISSVVPDPQVDFPLAVKLIEDGRFSTEGLFTHTMPISDVQKGFQLQADYQDEVIKLVLDFGKQ